MLLLILSFGGGWYTPVIWTVFFLLLSDQVACSNDRKLPLCIILGSRLDLQAMAILPPVPFTQGGLSSKYGSLLKSEPSIHALLYSSFLSQVSVSTNTSNWYVIIRSRTACSLPLSDLTFNVAMVRFVVCIDSLSRIST